MEKLLLLAVVLFSFSNLYSQADLRFDYDAAGNQIYRGALTSNQSQEVTEVLESLDYIVEEDDEASETDPAEAQLFIAASPNPVAHQLQVIWENTEHQYFIQLALFSYHNQHLMEIPLRASMQSLELDFSRYPQGVYFLIFTTDKFSTQTYKIIKR